MDTCIKQQSTTSIQNGISFPNGTVNIIVRYFFNTKMAALLDGAVYNLCSANMSQINDKELIRRGYPLIGVSNLQRNCLRKLMKKNSF